MKKIIKILFLGLAVAAFAFSIVVKSNADKEKEATVSKTEKQAQAEDSFYQEIPVFAQRINQQRFSTARNTLMAKC